MMDNRESVIDLLAENEETLGRLYSTYAMRFAEQKDFWEGMAGEERNHAAWIRDLKDKVEKGTILFDPNRFKAAAIRTFMNHTEKEITEAMKDSFRLINAISVAFYIEDSLIERKYFEVFETDSTEMKQLLINLDKATRKHAQTIKDLREKYSRGN